MDERERQLAADHLATGRDRLLDLADGLTAEQWTFQPGEGRWSISECLEHVTRVESRVFGMIGKKLEGSPEAEKRDSGEDSLRLQKDAELMTMVPNRTARREAPETTRPIGRWSDPAGIVAEFRKTRARSAQFVADTEANLRSYRMPHPALGELDCYQWVLLLGLHGERHARQIEEIKADPAFPSQKIAAGN